MLLQKRQKFAPPYIWRFPPLLFFRSTSCSKLQPRHFLWVHPCSSVLSHRALKLYLVRFLWRGDWPTIEGWQLSVAGQAVTSEWVRAPGGAEGEYWSSGSLLWRHRSPQVGLIPDRKCNSSPELRPTKSVEFKISWFLTLLAIRPHRMRKRSGECQDLLCLLRSCPAARRTSSSLLCLSCQRTLL